MELFVKICLKIKKDIFDRLLNLFVKKDVAYHFPRCTIHNTNTMTFFFSIHLIASLLTPFMEFLQSGKLFVSPLQAFLQAFLLCPAILQSSLTAGKVCPCGCQLCCQITVG